MVTLVGWLVGVKEGDGWRWLVMVVVMVGEGWLVLRKVMVDNDSDVNPTSFPASQCSLMLVTTIIRWWQLWSLDGDTDGHNNNQIISTIQLWYHFCFLLLSLDGEGALLRIKIIVMMRVFMKIMTNQNVNEVNDDDENWHLSECPIMWVVGIVGSDAGSLEGQALCLVATELEKLKTASEIFWGSSFISCINKDQ